MPTHPSNPRPKSSTFGSSINTRSFSAGSGFRFGFNTQEKDKEIYNNNETYTATFWEYDGRLGRRWNVDPVVKSHESPFATFANNPICYVDPSGRDTFKLNGSGQINQFKNTKNFHVFIYKDKNGDDQYLKNDKGGTNFEFNKNGLIKFPEQGQSFVTNGSPNKFIRVQEAAAIFGVSYSFFEQTGVKISIGQLSNPEGKHSGSGPYKFSCLDIMYISSSGTTNKTVWSVSDDPAMKPGDKTDFDIDKNKLLVSTIKSFGWRDVGDILTETYKNVNDVKQYSNAIPGTTFVDLTKFKKHHRHHMHLQRYNDDHINVEK